ncbi:3-hydroxyacyl-ACP dehydratase FabZ [bacterium]|nr:3-hydroxyacyl-ACP dehydratase FabZ [bacterium]
MSELTLPLDVNAIREILPHRYPFLLVDRVIEMVEGQSIVAIKCLSVNEPFFQGHFPQLPVMPGVLQIEALAQAGAILGLSMAENRGKIAYLTGADEFKFRRPVVPGDVLTLTVTMEKYRRGFGRAKGVASVNGETSCEGMLGFAIAAAK